MNIRTTSFYLQLLAMVLFPLSVTRAQQYHTTTATAYFEVEAPAKTIKGISEAVTLDINLQEGSVTLYVPVSSFRFHNNFVSDSLNAIIRDRFQTYYLEADRFPAVKYTGKFRKPELLRRHKVGTVKFHTEGTLLLHGVQRPVTAEGELDFSSGQPAVHAELMVQPALWGIRIPSYIGDMYFREVRIKITGTLRNAGKSPKRK